MKIANGTLAFALILALGLAAAAQTPAAKLTPVGTWVGTAENQGNYDDITVTIEKKENSYIGRVKDGMGMFPDVEIKNFVWKDDKVSFEFPGSMNGMGFNLKADLILTEKTLNGTWTMIEDGSAGAIQLNRK
ncbi:MAG: hypothetical protein JW843_08265 [Candidatus Aminicenantes bacterium]|nr:hypothetical protein [Candidatus Aminicenantes bacterium]